MQQTLCEYDFGLVNEPYCKEYYLQNLGNITVWTLNVGQVYTVDPELGSVYIMVMDGVFSITNEENQILCTLKSGCHAELTTPSTIYSQGNAYVIQTHYYRGLTRIGMQLENKCSLRFIDGCMDTLLISPLVKADPCLNFLYIPKNTTQTLHTHPSARLGMVLYGTGACVVESGAIDLMPNRFFIIQDNVLHQFLTTYSELGIFVFHPDSDFGPSNAEHPMINKSFIGRTSVTELRKIKDI